MGPQFSSRPHFLGHNLYPQHLSTGHVFFQSHHLPTFQPTVDHPHIILQYIPASPCISHQHPPPASRMLAKSVSCSVMSIIPAVADFLLLKASWIFRDTWKTCCSPSSPPAMRLKSPAESMTKTSAKSSSQASASASSSRS